MTIPNRNRQVRLTRQRDGMPEVADFDVVDAATPSPADGQILVRAIHLSLDPYIRKAIRGDHPGHRKLDPGDIIYGRSVCRVIESRHRDYAVGDLLVAETGWQLLAAIDAKKVVQRCDPALGPPSAFIGILGMPGLTAWGSVVRTAPPRLGDTFVVSAAAGPVGGIAGQLAKRAGARVVGIAGGETKCRIVVDAYGFDACVDYKKDNWPDALAAACPAGIDIYHDNVGGPVLTKVCKHLNLNARVVLCGRPGDYHGAAFDGVALGPFIGKRARLKGLVVYDFEPDMPRYLTVAAALMRAGSLNIREDRADGIDATAAHFIKVMRGDNVGKALVAVGPEN